MIFQIMKFLVRLMPDKWRQRLNAILLMEMAIVRPGNTLRMTVTLGKHDDVKIEDINNLEWSYIKKDRARAALKSGYSMVEVADAHGVSVSELKEQLLDEEWVDRLHSKATEAVREAHSNLNHCNAAGCDGVACEPTNDHTKGDF